MNCPDCGAHFMEAATIASANDCTVRALHARAWLVIGSMTGYQCLGLRKPIRATEDAV